MLQNLIKSIKVETAWGPPIILEDPFKPGDPNAPPNPALQFLKPRVTLNIEGVGDLPVAPYGEPGPSRWPLVKIAGLSLLAAAVYVVVVKKVIR